MVLARACAGSKKLTGDRALQYLLQNTRDNQILRKDLGFKGGWIQYLEDSQTGQESLAAV